MGIGCLGVGVYLDLGRRVGGGCAGREPGQLSAQLRAALGANLCRSLRLLATGRHLHLPVFAMEE